ncbi:RluA family pseudouridine synthase [Neoehrlichia mikurensis]|uniref:Pseudouridine synthase n=1 Tax=Neoehrlichia mikurensis TaxID=89586 RepID=A0A9Q9BYP1_9RICK|nr:RluA family pseudouridine synthase [Neoehrlichia mikurensis]QXK91855.1 RluA family pseudouridine synthase [Neoehrlichia mikurensis]QXK93547.1 RluA family pseudouridine synthase [Neoehrlichia mikurensis]UTO55498.1 RluA family pseudouridine synthase [Neoehrlichia mikurensis]UTO56420.1 RluA family pseudouridine synthase [Neoehrlichia mikurensis]
MTQKTVIIKLIEEKKSRLDIMIASKLSISRNKAQQLIANNHVKLYDKLINNKNYTINPNEIYEITIPTQEKHHHIIPNPNIPLDILYEDNDILVINKHAGITVHPGTGTKNDTIANALLARYNNISTVGSNTRPGIIHRLDKDTSGLMVIAKNQHAYYFLSNLFIHNKIIKEYFAIVWNIPNPAQDIIKTYIDVKRNNNKHMMTVTHSKGKLAITEYQVKERFHNIASLVKCKLHTGRTHQIRVHMSYIGNSIVGDQKYGKNSSKSIRYAPYNNFIRQFPRQALHACYMGFTHPSTNQYVEFRLKLSHDIQELISALRNIN